MGSEREPNPRVEIAHVLSMDLVGYSLLLITDQTRVMEELADVVKGTRRNSTARMHREDWCAFQPAMG